MKIAIVGSGISGLVSAFLLSPNHDVVLFEADERLGGHTHTFDVQEGGKLVPVDTGFIVFNTKTYPRFVRLLERLGVESQQSEMSFSVRSDRRDFEYNGRNLNALYSQRRNILSPRFHRMVLDILRFYREARELLSDGPEITLFDWLEQRGYSSGFMEDHILPMVGAVWSSNREGARAFPARLLVRFFENHGFLQLQERPRWLTISGGSREYVRAILAQFRGEVRAHCAVERIRRVDAGVAIRAAGAAEETFDHAIVACHADQALSLLEDPSPVEQELLAAFPYQPNETVLHSDERLMPRLKRTWASWNYHLDDEASSGAAVTYWMNHLQRLETPREYFVTLNRSSAIARDRVLARLSYAHPAFTPSAAEAQARHGELVNHRATSYCGAYWRNGFHEDGVVSALRACAPFEVVL